METPMYRMFKTLPSLALACAAAVTLAACNNSPSAPSSSDAGGVATEAGPNGETLKVQPPSPLAPANDVRLDSRRPVMVVSTVNGKFVGGSFSYEFELLTDGNSATDRATLPGGDGTTTWTYPADLERDTPYRWRARARLGSAVGPWSSSSRFITLFEKRTPDPPPGERLPLPNMFHIAQQVVNANPGIMSTRRSCQEEEWGGDHIGGWELMDKVVDALRLEDTRWGYMWKRGRVGDPSLDVITYHYGPGPDEGSNAIYAIDLIVGHCGPNAQIAWSNITGVGGSPAAWTSRGRW
jgi:hypothetical protein